MAKREPKKEITELDPKTVPEVVEYMVADEELKEYLEDVVQNNPGVLETMRELAERRNAALEAADKAVRAREAPCGPFKLHNVITNYDAEALYDAVGEERFLALGGSITKKPIYDVDGKRLEAAIALGKLGADVVDAVKTRQVQFKQIGKIWVP